MKKTISVTLNSIVFSLEEDAYMRLQEYLSNIRKYFSRSEAGESVDEILADIEASIADKFSGKLKVSKQVISLEDVDELVKVMGSVSDIAGGDEKASDDKDGSETRKDKDKEKKQINKKLYRNTDDIVIAGVCSGIASYFDIDPIVIRLVFFVSVFAGGAGIWIYLVLWLILPPARTSSEKLEMEGAVLTLKRLEDLARRKSQDIRNMDKSGIRQGLASPFKFVNEVFRSIGVFFRKFGRVIGVILGVLLSISSVLAITAIGFVSAVMIFNVDSPLFDWDIPVYEVVGYSMYNIAVVAFFFTVFVPLLYVLLLGTTLAARKNAFSALTNSLLVGLWMISIITLGVVGVDAAPKVQGKIDEYMTAETVTREFKYKDFDKIAIANNHEISVVPGDEFDIRAEGQDKDIENIKLGVYDNTLRIYNDTRGSFCLFCLPNRRVNFYITMPELSSINGSGAVNLRAIGFSGERMDISLSGASEGDFNLDYSDIMLNVSGASSVSYFGTSSRVDIGLNGASRARLNGNGDELIANLSGASHLNAFDFDLRKADIELGGSSEAEMSVSDELFVEGSGSAELYYIGDPKINEKLSAGAELIKRD